MNDSTSYLLLAGLLLPFGSAALGCATVFFIKREMGARLQKELLGFAHRRW